jgi:hypothetical protein
MNLAMGLKPAHPEPAHPAPFPATPRKKAAR